MDTQRRTAWTGGRKILLVFCVDGIHELEVLIFVESQVALVAQHVLFDFVTRRAQLLKPPRNAGIALPRNTDAFRSRSKRPHPCGQDRNSPREEHDDFSLLKIRKDVGSRETANRQNDRKDSINSRNEVTQKHEH
jgi:hypothetical protein